MRLFVLFMLLSASLSILAQEPLVFENQAQQDRFTRLTQELRCLVCQNQNLADSDAELAHDLRYEVYELFKAGKTNDEIKQFLVQRYGDFVLYRPPVQTNTYLLWLGPLVLLLGGALILRSNIKKRVALLDESDTVNDQDTVK